LALEFGLGSGEYYEANLLGTLTIPANVKAGYYSKSFTIMLTY